MEKLAEESAQCRKDHQRVQQRLVETLRGHQSLLEDLRRRDDERQRLQESLAQCQSELRQREDEQQRLQESLAESQSELRQRDDEQQRLQKSLAEGGMLGQLYNLHRPPRDGHKGSGHSLRFNSIFRPRTIPSRRWSNEVVLFEDRFYTPSRSSFIYFRLRAP